MPEPSRKTRLPPPANEGEGVVAEKDLREPPPINDDECEVSSFVGNSNEAAAPLWRSSAAGRDDRTATLLEDAVTRTADAAAVAVAACMVIRVGLAPENAARAADRMKEKMLLKSRTNETISSSSVAHISVDKARERSPSTPSDFVRLLCQKTGLVTSGYEPQNYKGGGIPEFRGAHRLPQGTAAHFSSALAAA